MVLVRGSERRQAQLGIFSPIDPYAMATLGFWVTQTETGIVLFTCPAILRASVLDTPSIAIGDTYALVMTVSIEQLPSLNPSDLETIALKHSQTPIPSVKEGCCQHGSFE